MCIVISSSFFRFLIMKDREQIKATEKKRGAFEEEKASLLKAQRGDVDAFADLYEKYSPKIYRFIYYRLNDKEEADDITQEVFLRAWGNIKKYKIKKFPFSAWLYRITKNALIDYWRAGKKQISLENELNEFSYSAQLANEPQDLNSAIDDEFNLNKIKTAFNFLPDSQKETIVLRFINDLEIEEVAKILNKSISTARVIQHRAIKNLRKILEA